MARGSIHRIFNCYWLKAILMKHKYFKRGGKGSVKPYIIACIDNKRNTLGMTDRFQGIITSYAVSKIFKTEFKCIYNFPFELREFLIPNKYNWEVKPNELSEYSKDVEIVILRKSPTIKPLLNKLPTKKQVYVYANLNYLDKINKQFNTNFLWRDVFNELFKPTQLLQDNIDLHLKAIGEEYIACVFRFQSLLNDFKEYNFSEIKDNNAKEVLINKNIKKIEEIISEYKMPVLVTSDSATFLERAKKIKGVYVIPGKVVHMGCSFNESNVVYLKSFVDFFMISKAKSVYCIGTKEMYPSKFPEYAAKLGNTPFERIILE